MTSSYKWIILTMYGIMMFLTFGLMMCMPVLFPAIVQDLKLTTVQIGIIWGLAAGAGIFAAFPSGLICDRIGIRLALGSYLCLYGVFGLLRGIADNFIFLAIMMFLSGLFFASILANGAKVIRMWFPLEQRGLGNGVLVAGGSIGGMVAAAMSATILLAILNTWRNVIFLWSGVAIVMGIIWLVTAREPRLLGAPPLRAPISESISRVIRVKDVWIAAVFMVGLLACYQGVSGYLPIFLENIGWTTATAGGALSAFLGVGIITSILIPALSDKVGLRKVFLIVSAYALAIFTFLIWPLAGSMTPLWLVIVIAGLGFGGAVPIVMCSITELEEVGPVYGGTAYGLLMTVQCLGGLIGPIIGNALAATNLALPFIFWGLLLGIFAVGIFFIRETGTEVRLANQK